MSPSLVHNTIINTAAGDTSSSHKDVVVSAADRKSEGSSAVMHRRLNELPYKVSNASGIYLILDSGRSIIDACGGAAVTSIGHGNKEVIAAGIAQMEKVSYVHTGYYTTGAAEDLAHIILDGNKHGLEKACFVGSGEPLQP